MHKLVTSSAHLLCWIIVAGFVAASVAYRFYVPSLVRNLWCANVITDPLSLLLGYFAPAAICAAIVLSVLWYRGAIRVWSPVSASVISALTIAALSAYGVSLYRIIVGDGSLSESVWWMRCF